MIRVYATNAGQRAGQPLAEFLDSELLMLSFVVRDLGAKLPMPRIGGDVRVDAGACTAILAAAHELAHEVDRVLDRRIPGEGIVANRDRWDGLLDVLRAGAAHNGLLVESD